MFEVQQNCTFFIISIIFYRVVFGIKIFLKSHHLSSEVVLDLQAALTHEVHDQLAHPGTEDEVPHEVGDEREGDADHRDHQVAGGQRQQEEVGDGPHALVPHQHGDDEAVAQDAEQEDQAVEDDPHRLVDVCGRDEDTRTRQPLRHSQKSATWLLLCPPFPLGRLFLYPQELRKTT